jgi:hypothetical protein
VTRPGRRRGARTATVAPALAAAIVVAIGAAGCGGSSRAADDPPATHTLAAVPASVTISLPSGARGRRIPSGFLGLSFEFSAVRTYTGDDPNAVNPVLEQLIRNLSPGQAPVLRIGGDSTDVSVVPGPGVHAAGYVLTPLTEGWLSTTGALAHDLGARMIMGINLGADKTRLAAAEGRAFERALGAGSIAALEIGNEPNIYGKIALQRSVVGAPVTIRPRTYGYVQYRDEYEATAKALPRLTLAGPALAAGPKPGPGSWVHVMSDFLHTDRRVRIMTVHRYPLRNCYVPPSSVQYPTVANLLSPYSTVSLANGVRSWVAIAHHQRRALRVDELNSVACRGKRGVSDRFATALWSVDALFSLLNVGVDGVNVHTLPKSSYELFEFAQSAGRWRAWVRPVYYGLQLFAQAAPRGSRLLSLPDAPHTQALSAWATRTPDGTTRVVLDNKDPGRRETVRLRPPPGGTSSATIERLTAPSVHSLGNVTLGGHGYGRSTSTGTLPAPETQSLAPDRAGSYTVTVPGGSAALVTLTAVKK